MYSGSVAVMCVGGDVYTVLLCFKANGEDFEQSVKDAQTQSGGKSYQASTSHLVNEMSY